MGDTALANELAERGIRDQRVLHAIASISRQDFVPADATGNPVGDYPMPIGFGQTISQPYIVAFMTEALEVGGEHKVLEIGTGSGYQAAVLAELAHDVFTIEIV